HALVRLGVLAAPVDWLGEDAVVMGAMIAVGIFVSLPFTTYVVLAGLASIPDEVYEAARVDGASRWRTYRSVTLPLLRPALAVAVVLNVIYVFNSFPIVWTLNDRNPGFGHDTLITYMYKIAFKSAARDVGLAAALGLVNVLMILVAVAVYRRPVPWRGGRARRGGGAAGGDARRRRPAALGAAPALGRHAPQGAKARGRTADPPAPPVPDALAARQLPRRLRRPRVPGLAGELTGGGGRLHAHRPA